MKRFKKLTGSSWFYYYLYAFVRGWKYRRLFSKIDTFVLFVGYPRSGHSLVGSLLDAHPNIVISNQLNALYFFKENYFRHQIYFFILKNALDIGKVGRKNSGYDYQVPRQWQGRYKQIEVIGDKRGGGTARLLADHDSQDILTKVKKTSQAEIKIIHVIRNPYDNISTMISRKMKKLKIPFSEMLFLEKFELYFSRVTAIQELKKIKTNQICDVYLDNLIADAPRELKRITDFLGIMASPEYLSDCASIIWPQANQSRMNLTIWSEKRIGLVHQKMSKVDFLKQFAFDSN